MTYAGLGLDEVQRRMHERYTEGDAYEAKIPWDQDRHQRICKTLLDLAVPTRLGLTLDVGCGENGAAAFWPEGCPLVGVEIAPAAVKKVRARYPQHEYHCCAIEKFFDNRLFDTVVAVESIEHWTDAAAGLDVIRKLVQPDGRFVLSTPNADSLHLRIGRKLGWEMPFCSSDHVHEFGFDELRALLEEHGFRVVQSRGVYLAPWWALENEFGRRIRQLTDHDEEVVRWLAEIGEHCPPEYAFIQCHACVPC